MNDSNSVPIAKWKHKILIEINFNIIEMGDIPDRYDFKFIEVYQKETMISADTCISIHQHGIELVY